jgi:hypothetical protein
MTPTFTENSSKAALHEDEVPGGEAALMWRCPVYEALPAEVEVSAIAGGVRYVLPPATGIPRPVGPLLIGFGLIPIGMGASFMALSLGILEAPFPFNLFILFVWLVPIAFVLIGLALTWLGAFYLVGRTEIELTRDSLSGAMRVGPFRWRGTRRRGKVLHLALELSRSDDEALQPASCQLTAECQGARRLVLAHGQSNSTLAAVADHLSQRWMETGGKASLPVQEVEPGASSLRAWRRAPANRLAANAGCAMLFNYFFFGIFLAAGCLCFGLIASALVRGDPGNNLQGKFPIKYLWILFPFPFIAVGAGGLIHHLRERSLVGLSPELKAASGSKADGMAESPRAALPMIPEVVTTPGSMLAHRLAWSDSPGLAVVGFLVLLLMCSGILTPVVYNVIGVLRVGNLIGPAVMAGFFVLILGLFWVLLAGSLVKNWRLWRLGQPIVEISSHPLYPGETCEVQFSFPGTMRLDSLELTILCEEEVRFQEESDTHIQTRCVYRQMLDDSQPGVSHRFQVPTGAMHSFEAPNNKVRWLVRIEGQTAGMFGVKFKNAFPLAVHPPREGGAW